MKKSIWGIFLIMSSMVFCDIKPMETSNSVCFLFSLPLDVLNYIAAFLWESKEDFIKRAETESKEIKMVPKEYYSFYPNYKEWDNILGVFSEDHRKIALFELLCGTCFKPEYCDSCPNAKLVIINTHKKEEQDQIIYNGCLENKCYRALAISSCGTMIAVIRKQKIEEEGVVGLDESYRDFLIIKQMNEEKQFVKEKEQILEIPKRFIVNNLLFNKQHTKLMVYGNDYSDSDEGKEQHILFRYGKKREDSSCNLYDYFECFRVRKNPLTKMISDQHGKNKKTS